MKLTPPTPPIAPPTTGPRRIELADLLRQLTPKVPEPVAAQPPAPKPADDRPLRPGSKLDIRV